jgi:hypothetical protein
MKTTGRKTVKGDKVSAPKAVKAAPSKKALTVRSVSTPTHDEIAKRSYELYLERGSVDGFASDDWARAEAELKSH